MMERREYSPASVAAKIESSTCSLELLPTPRRKKNKNKNKKRFSDEQIRSLESMFESETKLEPRKKVQLARELELQPRQVAIWFQNRRARWKSKQIEHDYKILKANYDNLTSKFESLKKEKQSLLIQLHKLNDLLEKPHCGSMGSEGLAGNSTDGGSDNGDTNCEFEAKLSCLKEGLDHRSVFMCSDDDKSRNIRYFGQEEGTDQLLNTGERVDGPLASPEKWCSSLDSAVLFDQSCSSSQYWWDFWT